MIEKSQDLKNFLAQAWLNPTIFTWPLPIGETIEKAIDWVLEPINTLATWAGKIGAVCDEFRQEVVDIFNLIPQWINEVWEFVLNRADAILGVINAWWEPKWQAIKDFLGEKF